MSACKQCKLEVRWVRDGKRRNCLNLDGSDHWDLCSQTRTKLALREGTPFQEKHGSGVRHDGRKKYMHRSAPHIVGPHYQPSGCDCGIPPWEACVHSTLVNGLPA